MLIMNNPILPLLLLIVFMNTYQAIYVTFESYRNITVSSRIRKIVYSMNDDYLFASVDRVGIQIYRTSDYQYVGLQNIGFNSVTNTSQALQVSNNNLLVAYNVINGATGSNIIVLNSNSILSFNRTFPSSIINIADLHFSYYSQRMIVCGARNLTIFNLINDSIIINVRPPQTTTGDQSKSCKFSKNNYYAISIARQIFIYNDIHQIVYRYASNHFITYLDWNPDGTALAFGQKFMGIFVYYVNTNSTRFFASITNMKTLNWSPDGKYIVFHSYGYGVYILNSQDLTIFASWTDSYDVYSIQFSHDSNFIAYGTFDHIPTSSLLPFKICIYKKKIICQLAFYPKNYLCLPCNTMCLSCDGSNCQVCSQGIPLGNGCTKVIGCAKLEEYYINTTNNCKQCNQTFGFFHISAQMTCQCPIGYHIHNNICHNINGCIGPIINNQKIQCKICDSKQNFQLYNKICSCKKGYQILEQRNQCQEICGDGTLFKHECDDGNMNNGDGCSSQCNVQANYKCQNGSQTQASSCFYDSSKIFDLLVVSIDKKINQNLGLFTFKFSPYHKILQKASLNQIEFKYLGFQSFDWSYSAGQLSIQTSYNQTIQNQQAQLTFNLDNVFYKRSIPFSLIFNITSSGSALIFLSNSQGSQLWILQIIMSVVVGLILVLFVVQSILHKMAGVQLINMYQIIFYVFLLEKKVTSVFSIFQFFTYSNMNFLYFFNQFNNYNAESVTLQYNPFNQVSSSLIYYVLVTVAFIILGLFALNDRFSYQQLTTLKAILYNKFIFPITMAFFYEIYYFSYVHQQRHSFYQNNVFILISVLFKSFTIIVMFFQIKNIFFRTQQKQYKNHRLKKSKKNYIGWYTTCYCITVFFIIISTIYSFTLYKEILAAFFSLLLMVFICIRPYEQMIHNITQVTNLTMLVFFLIFTILRDRMLQIFTQTANQIFAVFIFQLFLVVNIIANIIRTITMIINKCKEPSEDNLIAIIAIDDKIQQQNKVFHKFCYQNYHEDEGKKVIQSSAINSIVNNIQRSIQHQQYIKARRILYHQQVNAQLL